MTTNANQIALRAMYDENSLSSFTETYDAEMKEMDEQMNDLLSKIAAAQMATETASGESLDHQIDNAKSDLGAAKKAVRQASEARNEAITDLAKAEKKLAKFEKRMAQDSDDDEEEAAFKQERIESLTAKIEKAEKAKESAETAFAMAKAIKKTAKAALAELEKQPEQPTADPAQIAELQKQLAAVQKRYLTWKMHNIKHMMFFADLPRISPVPDIPEGLDKDQFNSFVHTTVRGQPAQNVYSAVMASNAATPAPPTSSTSRKRSREPKEDDEDEEDAKRNKGLHDNNGVQARVMPGQGGKSIAKLGAWQAQQTLGDFEGYSSSDDE